MNIKKNIGMFDRMARIVMGIIFLLFVPLAFFGPKTDLALLGLFGIIPLISGIIGYCPPYVLLGINTHKKQKTVNQ
jgi:hypothetical protein